MELWWNSEEVLARRDRLRRRLIEQSASSDFDDEIADSVLRLAIRGLIEVGERDGIILVRIPEWAHDFPREN